MVIDYEDEADRTLIQGLLDLHYAHDKEHDTTARGKLANLRYGLRDRLHADYPCGRVFPALTIGALTGSDERNEWRTLIAALYGFAHDDVMNVHKDSLGSALRTLYDKLGRESLELRFMALLNSDDENLPGHLRQAISLLKADKTIGLDWGLLLSDVCQWNVPGKRVHKQWTRDYYRARSVATVGGEETPKQNNNEGDDAS